MRIVGGKYKGRIFNPNKKFAARPTTDRAKESLFNILENRYDISGMKVLDLFSGTGSIGYEFASRGAGEVTFVEKNNEHVRFINEVVNKLELPDARIIRDDVFRFLKNCPYRFDLIFADPPFDLKHLNEIPDATLNSEVLQTNGLFILEHPAQYSFTKHPRFLELRKYGKVNFSLFQ